eukprot:scaffold2257_cov169-Amphora_coffeaeformis.AAC.4
MQIVDPYPENSADGRRSHQTDCAGQGPKRLGRNRIVIRRLGNISIQRLRRERARGAVGDRPGRKLGTGQVPFSSTEDLPVDCRCTKMGVSRERSCQRLPSCVAAMQRDSVAVTTVSSRSLTLVDSAAGRYPEKRPTAPSQSQDNNNRSDKGTSSGNLILGDIKPSSTVHRWGWYVDVNWRKQF